MKTSRTALVPPDRTDGTGRRLSYVLLAAFGLSVVHTVYAAASGLADPGFTVTTPLTWVFYGLGFSVAALARRDSPRVQACVLAYVVVVLAIAVFYYPTTFEPRQQTAFAWFENDVYAGLLVLATYLAVERRLGRQRGA